MNRKLLQPCQYQILLVGAPEVHPVWPLDHHYFPRVERVPIMPPVAAKIEEVHSVLPLDHRYFPRVERVPIMLPAAANIEGA